MERQVAHKDFAFCHGFCKPKKSVKKKINFVNKMKQNTKILCGLLAIVAFIVIIVLIAKGYSPSSSSGGTDADTYRQSPWVGTYVGRRVIYYPGNAFPPKTQTVELTINSNSTGVVKIDGVAQPPFMYKMVRGKLVTRSSKPNYMFDFVLSLSRAGLVIQNFSKDMKGKLVNVELTRSAPPKPTPIQQMIKQSGIVGIYDSNDNRMTERIEIKRNGELDFFSNDYGYSRPAGFQKDYSDVVVSFSKMGKKYRFRTKLDNKYQFIFDPIKKTITQLSGYDNSSNVYYRVK